MSVGDSDAMFPCCEVAHEPKRSAIVAAHPSCMSGVRQPTPTSGGTWNAPPVPTSTVVLFVNLAPEWQTEQPTSARWKIARPAAAAFGSTHVGGGGAGMALTHAESAPVWAVVRDAAHPRHVDVPHDGREVRARLPASGTARSPRWSRAATAFAARRRRAPRCARRRRPRGGRTRTRSACRRACGRCRARCPASRAARGESTPGRRRRRCSRPRSRGGRSRARRALASARAGRRSGRNATAVAWPGPTVRSLWGRGTPPSLPSPNTKRLSTDAAPPPLPAATAATVEPSAETATSTGRTPLNCCGTDVPSLAITVMTLITGPLPKPGGRRRGGGRQGTGVTVVDDQAAVVDLRRRHR